MTFGIIILIFLYVVASCIFIAGNMFDKSRMEIGNSNLIPGLTVHGAIILSDHQSGVVPNAQETSNQTLRLISARIHNYLQLQSQLPFRLTKWSAVFNSPCPHYPNGHKSERGLLWAHYRIWRDFIYFDNYLLFLKGVDKTNHTITSEDGVYKIYANHTKVKHKNVFDEKDIIVIFEDDAISVIPELNTTMIEELNDMKVDILYLGWCEGRTARPVPLCAHAYAITRTGARKLVKYLEPCGLALDEQLVILAKNNWITYRRAHAHSTKVYRNDLTFDPRRDKFYGIFHQCKDTCASINGHRK